MTRHVLWLTFVLCALFLVDTGSAQMNHMYVVKSGASRGWLGVTIQDITPRIKEKSNLTVTSGAYVADVEEGSPADDAGIQEGDVIVKFDGKEIDDSNELTKAVRKAKPKSDAVVEIIRKGEHKNLTVKVGKDRFPDAFSYSLGDRGFPSMPKMPKIPRMRFNFRTFSQSEYNGMAVEELTKQLAEYFEVPGRHGLLVVEVEKGSDAEKAGVKAGDVITKVNSSSVSDMNDLRDEFDQAEGKEMAIQILRKGKTIDLTLHRTDAEEESEDDDAMLMNPSSGCPADHSAGSIESKIFSRDFVHQLLLSLHELKDRLVHRIEGYTQKIRMTVARFGELHPRQNVPAQQS